MDSNQIIKTRVSGTSANIGPGFDSLGIALNIFSYVEVSWQPFTKCNGKIISNGKKGLKNIGQAMAEDISKSFFKQLKIENLDFYWKMYGDVPICGGLGSSVILRLGIISGLNQLLKINNEKHLNTEDLYRLCFLAEGHSDNAAPAAFGGFVASNYKGFYIKHDIDPSLKFLIVCPEKNVLTEAARNILPDKIPFFDAIKNIGNATLITSAFASKKYELLKQCHDDWIHQNYRKKLNSTFDEIKKKSLEAGALSCYISGSGPTICSIAFDDNSQAIMEAMHNSIPKTTNFTSHKLSACNHGLSIIEN